MSNFSRPKGEVVFFMGSDRATTTVTGAYPKIADGPGGQDLRKALHQFDRGELDRDGLERVLAASIAHAVREIEAAGVEVPNHGEIRWEDAFSPFVTVWRNVRRAAIERFFDNNTYYRIPTVDGPIAVEGPATVTEFEQARASATRPVKAAICGPLTFARLADDRHYRSRRALALAVAGALREELRALAAAGCALVDVEEPGLVRWPSDLDMAAEVYGELARDVALDLALQLPMFPADPIIDRLADLPFAQIGIDLRSRPTRSLDRVAALPRTVVLGVVDARNTKLESAEAVARDYDAAVERIGAERVWLAPTTSLEYLPHDVARAKLDVLVAGAGLALAAGGAR